MNARPLGHYYLMHLSKSQNYRYVSRPTKKRRGVRRGLPNSDSGVQIQAHMLEPEA